LELDTTGYRRLSSMPRLPACEIAHCHIVPAIDR
jgi:hypothetical protein